MIEYGEAETWHEVLAYVRDKSRGITRFNLYKRMDGAYRLMYVPDSTTMDVVKTIYGDMVGIEMKHEDPVDGFKYVPTDDTKWETRRAVILRLVELAKKLRAAERVIDTDVAKAKLVEDRDRYSSSIAGIRHLIQEGESACRHAGHDPLLSTEANEESKRVLVKQVETRRVYLEAMNRTYLSIDATLRAPDNIREELDALGAELRLLSFEGTYETDQEKLEVAMTAHNDAEKEHATTGDPALREDALKMMTVMNLVITRQRALITERKKLQELVDGSKRKRATLGAAFRASLFARPHVSR